MGVGLCQGVWGVPHACVHAHTHVQVMMSYRDSPGFPYGSSHLHEIIMFIHVNMCVCMRMHVQACMCAHAWGTPKHPDRVPSPSTHP